MLLFCPLITCYHSWLHVQHFGQAILFWLFFFSFVKLKPVCPLIAPTFDFVLFWLIYFNSNQLTSLSSVKENALSHFKIPENTDYAMVMGIVHRMIEQDYCMQVTYFFQYFFKFIWNQHCKYLIFPGGHNLLQEKIVSALNFKTSSGELESYCLMWSLRPFINDEIMQQAWKLVPWILRLLSVQCFFL